MAVAPVPPAAGSVVLEPQSVGSSQDRAVPPWTVALPPASSSASSRGPTDCAARSFPVSGHQCPYPRCTPSRQCPHPKTRCLVSYVLAVAMSCWTSHCRCPLLLLPHSDVSSCHASPASAGHSVIAGVSCQTPVTGCNQHLAVGYQPVNTEIVQSQHNHLWTDSVRSYSSSIYGMHTNTVNIHKQDIHCSLG